MQLIYAHLVYEPNLKPPPIYSLTICHCTFLWLLFTPFSTILERFILSLQQNESRRKRRSYARRHCRVSERNMDILFRTWSSDHWLSHDRLLEGEFIPGAGDEFSEIGGPAAIRNLDTDPILRIQGSNNAIELNSFVVLVNYRYVCLRSNLKLAGNV